MKDKTKCVVISSQYLITDPPTNNIVQSFCRLGWNVSFVQQAPYSGLPENNASFLEISRINIPGMGILSKIINWIHFKYRFGGIIRRLQPDLVITIMYYPVSAIKPGKYNHLVGILDIPSLKYAGKFDRLVIKRALRKIGRVSFVWASDPLKAALIKNMAGRRDEPLVCYNTPLLDYFQNLTKSEARAWVAAYLSANGVLLTDNHILLLRAGAIGEGGGLEETINALTNLPEELVFVMMGRPDKAYAENIKEKIELLQLQKRVILIETPEDLVWKKMLLAADIGHLIHIKASTAQPAANYDLNSSLSNNRLFQYMMAGMPIISYADDRMNGIYKEIDCFVVVNTDDLQNEMEKACNQLMNAELRYEKAEQAVKASKDIYNWDKQFESIKGVLKQF